MRQLGWIGEKLPRLVAVQAAGLPEKYNLLG
jgi:hypothetical protein